MSNVKNSVLKEIEDRIKKRELAKARAANNNTLEKFASDFFHNIEELRSVSTGVDFFHHCIGISLLNFETQVSTIDRYAKVELVWVEVEGKLPLVDRIVITWSKPYQIINRCDPQLSLDMANLILFN